MNLGLSINNFSNFAVVKNHKTNPVKVPSFGAGQSDKSQGLTPEQAAALAAAQNINKKTDIPHITEDDINFAVTCMGQSEVSGNTRDVYDYRSAMYSVYGNDWSKNFNKPSIVYNMNQDERINGETTALVIPLHPHSRGIRGADNMAMVLSGKVSQKTINELVLYMAKVGILNSQPIWGKQFYVNSTEPKSFMENPKIKTAIASFFKQKELEQAKQANTAQKPKETNDSKGRLDMKVSDINIVNIGLKQDKNNKRVVKDYVRDFLNNDKKFTVVYDKFTENNQEKDMTVMLIPSKKSEWDCITVTFDKKIPQQECKNLINSLVKKNAASVDDENFRGAIVEYFKNVDGGT